MRILTPEECETATVRTTKWGGDGEMLWGDSATFFVKKKHPPSRWDKIKMRVRRFFGFAEKMPVDEL